MSRLRRPFVALGALALAGALACGLELAPSGLDASGQFRFGSSGDTLSIAPTRSEFDALTAVVAGKSTSQVLPSDYTVATLPAAASNARKYAWVTDLYGGTADYVLSNGTNWIPVRPSYTASQASSTMTLQTLASPPTMILTGTIGTGVTNTVTLGTTNAYRGAKFLISRKATGLGFLMIGSLNVLQNSWAQWEYDGTAWVQVASGGLL